MIRLEQAEERSIEGRGAKRLFFHDKEDSLGFSFSVVVLKPKSPAGNYHRHTKSASIYYVLEGTARILLGGIEYDLQKDTSVFIERNEPHSISNVGDSNLKMIEIYSPSDPDVVVEK